MNSNNQPPPPDLPPDLPPNPRPPISTVCRPRHLELQKDKGLTVYWHDGTQDFYPIIYLRRLSPSAEARQLREEMAKNPLTVLPASVATDSDQPLTATGAEMIGNYAVRIIFSDGHDTGIYSWHYLQQIAPDRSLSSTSSSTTK